MDRNSLIIVFAVVLVASFAGALLGAYLVEKTSVQPRAQFQQPGSMQPGGQMSPHGNMMPSQGSQPAGQNLCGDGTCDAFEKQNNVCPEDCKK